MNIYNLEVTNHCNASCSYCPHSKMTRPKGHMTLATFTRVLDIMENKYLVLHNFGEPLLNPLLPEFIKLAESRGIRTEFSTNGGVNDPDLLEAIMKARPYRIRIAFDEYQPIEFIKFALTHNQDTIINLHSVKGLLDVRKPFNNFAGAVEGESEIKGGCYFRELDYYTILWNGDISRCCQDYDGKGVTGSVWSDTHVQNTNCILCVSCAGMQFADNILEAQ